MNRRAVRRMGIGPAAMTLPTNREKVMRIAEYFDTEERVSSTCSTIYKQEYVRQAFVACSIFGAREVDLAALFGVVQNTIELWVRKYDDFKEALVTGRDMYYTLEVEMTLKRRALGYDYDEVHIEHTLVTLRRGNGKNGKKTLVRMPGVKRKVVTKHMPGDPASIFFWLQNRNAERWKNTQYLKANIKLNKKEEKTFRLQIEDLKKLPVRERELLLTLYDRIEHQPRETKNVTPAPGVDGETGGSKGPGNNIT